MDDILELLNMPSWSDIGGLRNQLDQSSATISSADTTVKSDQAAAEEQQQQLLNHELLQQQHHQFVPPSLGINCNVMAAALPLRQNMHVGEGSTLSSNLLIPTSSPVFDWRHQPYIGELQSFISAGISSSSNPGHSYGTSRYRTGSVPLSLRTMNREAARGGATQLIRPPAQTMQASSRAYRSHPPGPQPPSSGGVPRPRVRARRGQATDPHSIAERQRRERIAERMKDLQVLVPNASKTDKAIMLDEIIDYVKFLQLQAKILDISHQHGTVPSVLPSEFNNTLGQSNGTSLEALVNMERQVARLMDENMDAALQFLQSKGFCLMPIPMATALSAATTGINQPLDKLEACSTIVTSQAGGSS